MPKNKLSMLVHSGTPAGSVSVIHDQDTSSEITFPSLDYKTNGKEKLISNVAAGISSLVDLDPKKRIQFISDMMHSLPIDADLKQDFDKAGIVMDDKTFKILWGKIQLNGWDSMWADAKQKGSKLKGAWEFITGNKKYGVRIAESWKPVAWELDLETAKLPDLEKAVSEAYDWVIAAEKQTAVTDEEKNRLTEISLKKGSYEHFCKSYEDQHNNTDELIRSKRTELNNLEVADLVCPSCDAQLKLKNNKLHAVVEVENVEKAKKTLTDELTALNAQKNELLKKWGEQKTLLRQSYDAETALEVMEESEDKDSDSLNLEELKLKHERAVSRRESFINNGEATKKYNNIVLNEKIIKILAPDGVRGKKLADDLKKINTKLREFCESAGWKILEITDDFKILFGGFEYGDSIAKSERYRAKAILQIVVAMAERAEFMLIDDCDELTKTVRNQLMKIIIKSGIPAIVAVAMEEDSPDLSKMGGKSYNVSDGVCREVK
jgi:hypothetical protein